MNWYLAAFKKYAVFSGRSRRKEYWFFVLFNMLVGIALAIVDSVLGTPGSKSGAGTLALLYNLAVLIPAIAVSIRRLHDTGRSGWWLLFGFVPIVGVIVLVVFNVQDSQPGDNQYGPNPKT